jgi:hypothetical protein
MYENVLCHDLEGYILNPHCCENVIYQSVAYLATLTQFSKHRVTETGGSVCSTEVRVCKFFSVVFFCSLLYTFDLS